MDIRLLAPADRAQVRALVASAIRAGAPGHYSGRQARAWHAGHGAHAIQDAEFRIVAAEGSRVLGVAGSDARCDFCLRFLFVDPACWGRGAGSALLRAAQAFCLRRGVAEIRVASATNAVGFYARCGFVRRGKLTLLMPREPGDRRLVDVPAVAMSLGPTISCS